MLKIASHTAYRSAARSPSSILSKKPAWVNTSRSISLSPHGSSHTSPAGTPTRNRSPTRGFATTSASTGKQDPVANAPPQHELVHFPGLASERRRFGDCRRVLHTGLYSQLAAMAIPPGGAIGAEVHAVDQTLLFTHGAGVARVAGADAPVRAGDVVVVPAGARHRFLNTGPEPLELVTVCAPAEHGARTVHGTKGEGDGEEEEAPAWARRARAGNEEVGLVKERRFIIYH
ncbi:Cupin RmlC-type [Neofusicoccum parvum]|nr:Cupin RmlC-type [Neofusicoccum parvum]